MTDLYDRESKSLSDDAIKRFRKWYSSKKIVACCLNESRSASTISTLQVTIAVGGVNNNGVPSLDFAKGMLLIAVQCLMCASVRFFRADEVFQELKQSKVRKDNGSSSATHQP